MIACSVHHMLDDLIEQIAALPLAERVDALNLIRGRLADVSPFADHPVDFVRWVPESEVTANDYNPNAVAPPEMELLRLSIAADGYTQPIVANRELDGYEVVDGFHRNRVGKECDEVRDSLHGGNYPFTDKGRH